MSSPCGTLTLLGSRTARTYAPHTASAASPGARRSRRRSSNRIRRASYRSSCTKCVGRPDSRRSHVANRRSSQRFAPGTGQSAAAGLSFVAMNTNASGGWRLPRWLGSITWRSVVVVIVLSVLVAAALKPIFVSPFTQVLGRTLFVGIASSLLVFTAAGHWQQRWLPRWLMRSSRSRFARRWRRWRPI